MSGSYNIEAELRALAANLRRKADGRAAVSTAFFAACAVMQ